MQRQLVVSLILIVVLLGVGIGVSQLLIRKRSEAPAREPEQRALVVQAMRLEPRTVTEQIVGYGTARADRYGWISTQVAGEVAELAEGLKVGAEVKEGQLLVHIDEREYREQLRRAESLLAADEAQLATLDVEEQNLERLIEIATSELEIARREYDRVRGLLEQEAAGRRELDLARAAYEMTRRVLQTHENAKALLPQRRAQQKAT
ncbi:MAG TPA: biotin/lipoyl-binding protein, partial [Phycisphaerae bacterium]|nr:biotin/lipoyl-binding protein [Phycisphaerae bacterium]